MNSSELAALHAEAFTSPRPWSEAEFQDVLAGPGAFMVTEDGGFVIGRVAADESELLTIAVPQSQRRKGAGTRLLKAFVAVSEGLGASRAFLEVASDNKAAVSLYEKQGWAKAGTRKNYYPRRNTKAADAVVYKCMLEPS